MSSTAPLRIGYVVKRYPRYSETFVVNEILAHESAGLEIEIYSLQHTPDEHFQDVLAWVRAPVKYFTSEDLAADDFWHTLREGGEGLPAFETAINTMWDVEARYIYQAVLIAVEARHKNIGHLHAHFADEVATVTRLAARFAGLPYSFTAHARDIFLETVCQDSLRQNLADAAAVVTVSEYNLEYLHRIYGADAAHVRRIYNGLDLTLFPFESPQDRPLSIIAVGRLVEKKGFANLIEACAILAGRGFAFGCQIIGTGPLDGDLRAQIERLGLQGHVQLTGPLPRSEVIKRVQEAAALVAPSVVASDNNQDGLPMVLLEAMALGTPCVSTNVTGIPEVLRNGETGLMVGQHDPPGLAVALERLLTNPALRVQLSSRARHLVEAEFDIQHTTSQLRTIFGDDGLVRHRTLDEVR